MGLAQNDDSQHAIRGPAKTEGLDHPGAGPRNGNEAVLPFGPVIQGGNFANDGQPLPDTHGINHSDPCQIDPVRLKLLYPFPAERLQKTHPRSRFGNRQGGITLQFHQDLAVDPVKLLVWICDPRHLPSRDEPLYKLCRRPGTDILRAAGRTNGRSTAASVICLSGSRFQTRNRASATPNARLNGAA